MKHKLVNFSREYCISHNNFRAKAYESFAFTRRLLVTHIEGLMSDLETGVDFHIKISAQWVYDNAEQFKGYVTCLFDTGFINENDYDILYYFSRTIQLEVDDIMQSYIKENTENG